MKVFKALEKDDFEQIVFCQDNETGLKGIIAIHSTALGPATGGCRLWNYDSEEDALVDALRLSKGMTYKAAISRLSMGGGKSVIFCDEKHKTPALLQKFGEFVDRLGGNYVTAKDVGINNDDLLEMRKKTKCLLGVAGMENSSGDPSPVTAWGVYNGLQASAEKAFGSRDVKGKKIALQGLGSVNYYLAKHLHDAGAELFGCDINKDMIERARSEFKMEIVEPEKIYDIDCDIFSPGALGAIVNKDTIPRLKCKVIAGGANNQLATDQDGEELVKRGIVYAPDYAINAGGLINIYHEREGYNKQEAMDHVAHIYDTIKEVLETAEREGKPTNVVADSIAQARVDNARKK